MRAGFKLSEGAVCFRNGALLLLLDATCLRMLLNCKKKAESVTSVEVELVARTLFFTESSPSPSHSSPSWSPASSSSCRVLKEKCVHALMPVKLVVSRVWFGFCFALPQLEPRWQLPAAKLLLTASVPKRYHTADAEIGGSVWFWRTCVQSKEID